MPPQLSPSDRAVLAELLKMQLSKQAIARRRGKHRSVIYRELARNTDPIGDIHQEAQQRSDVRRRWGRRKRKMPVRRLGGLRRGGERIWCTIVENIRYGRLDAIQPEVEAAARSAGAHPFIVAFPNGYDTEVGEDGNQLSLGQKQLISIAHAILKRPRLLVMDGATSSVDTETEQLIQHALLELLGGQTSFVIAHRLSTIRAADRILVIEKCKVIEQATHNVIVRLRVHYHDLCAEQ